MGPTEDDPPAFARPGAPSSSLSLSSTIARPKLKRNDAESVRIFLRSYDQYVTEIEARALKWALTEVVASDALPISMKLYIDDGYLDSSIALGFIPGVSSIDDLTDEILRIFLEEKSSESKETLTLASVDSIVSKKLKMDMRDRSATSRMQGLFISYRTIQRDNGLSWVLEKQPTRCCQPYTLGHQARSSEG